MKFFWAVELSLIASPEAWPNWHKVKATAAYQQSLVAASLYVDYVFLDTDERRRMAQNPHEYLIEQLQFTGDESVGSSSNKIKLNFNHPCKEVVFRCSARCKNVNYCASLECGTVLNNALGAQPFNYTDAVDALPNALHCILWWNAARGQNGVITGYLVFSKTQLPVMFLYVLANGHDRSMPSPALSPDGNKRGDRKRRRTH